MAITTTTTYSPNRLIRVATLGADADFEGSVAVTAADLDNVANVYSGTLASRPAASASAGHAAANPGSLYYATDTNQLFLSLGGAWKTVAVSSGPQAWQGPLTISGGGPTWSVQGLLYMKDALGVVRLAGTVTASGEPLMSTVLATLPSGYRPDVNYTGTIPALHPTGPASLTSLVIDTLGQVYFEAISVGGNAGSRTYRFGSVNFLTR